MDIANYYITTLTNAALKLGPTILFIVVGYFLFIKLPFYLMMRINNENKRKNENKPKFVEPKEQINHSFSWEQKEFTNEQKKERKQETKKEKVPEEKILSKPSAAEEMFGLKSGQSVNKQELRKKYHELLKQNHPDKVISEKTEFRKLAEKKTKDINKAYEQLKKKAS